MLLILVISFFVYLHMDILSETLKQGIAPAAVVAIYLIITKIIDAKKEDNQIKLNADFVKSINVLSEFLTDITKNIIDREKEKCKSAIEDAMFASAMRLVTFVSSTIINNHIDANKATILSNIKTIVNSEFYSIFSTLSMYKINNIVVSDYLNKEWMTLIEQDIIDIIYNTSLDKDDKILSFSNKINIKFQSYVTYIINNVIK